MTDFDFDVIYRGLPFLWQGMQYSLLLTCVATVGGIGLGTLLALGKLSPIPALAFLAGLYVNLFRSVPLVLVIFWFYFLVPFLAQWITHATQPIAIGADKTALITFTLFEAAFFCEIVRAGIQAIPPGQTAAGMGLGLTYRQNMQLIVLPQAFRIMLPIFLTQVIVLFQDTSLVYVISVTDFLGAAAKIAQRDFRLVEMYSFVALVYFAICFLLSRSVKYYQSQQQGAR